uniref:Uncharacterized protein n=1 Tax=Zooxanthella nutricula TaxID=1333877 RepID=A0A6U6PKU8_9DINO
MAPAASAPAARRPALLLGAACLWTLCAADAGAERGAALDDALDGALASDGECAEDGQCAVGLMQLRGRSADGGGDALAEFRTAAADAGVTECCSGCSHGFCSPSSFSCHFSKSKPYYKDCDHIAAEATKGCTIHEERIANVWDTCADKDNLKCDSCGLYRAKSTPGLHGGGCPGYEYVGEKVVPTRPLGGAEGITMLTASSFDGIWPCSAKKTHSSPDEALMMNPWRARTQHHLHIVVKPLSNNGRGAVKRIEAVTGCLPGMWHDAHWGCHYSKARLYSSMPNVFSDVLSLAQTGAFGILSANPIGQQTLATLGISVLFVCGGRPAILATSNGQGTCSVEHQLT